MELLSTVGNKRFELLCLRLSTGEISYSNSRDIFYWLLGTKVIATFKVPNIGLVTVSVIERTIYAKPQVF